jgi:hypothetical protein
VANGPTGKTDPSGLEGRSKPETEATDRAKKVLEILRREKIIDALKAIAKGTDTLERGGAGLRTGDDSFAIQECTNKRTTETHFQHAWWPEDRDWYLPRPSTPGDIVSTNNIQKAGIDFTRPIVFLFHAHPRHGDYWPSPADCERPKGSHVPEVVIQYQRLQGFNPIDQYLISVVDIDGMYIELKRIQD